MSAVFHCAYGCGNRVEREAQVCFSCVQEESRLNAEREAQSVKDLTEVRSMKK